MSKDTHNGIVYVLSNRAMPGLVKIGMTIFLEDEIESIHGEMDILEDEDEIVKKFFESTNCL